MYLFLYAFVKERCLDVELKGFPVFVRSNGECHPDDLDKEQRSVGATAVIPGICTQP